MSRLLHSNANRPRTPRPAKDEFATIVRREILAPPAWVHRLIGAHRGESSSGKLHVLRGEEATLVSLSLPDARALDGDRFRAATSDLYRTIGRALCGESHPAIVRIWNFLPGIHDHLSIANHGDAGAGEDRYQWFNAGRFDVMSEWFGDRASGRDARRLGPHLPAASAVGHDGDALVVHALAMREPGIAIENPQQVPAFRYSRRFGPLPPCFSRATRVKISDSRSMLLISGTAAIRGESSEYDGDVHRQWALTMMNLRTLIESHSDRQHGSGAIDDRNALHSLQDLRVYVHPSIPLDRLHDNARRDLGDERAATIEWLPATMCRAELLVEIEANLIHDYSESIRDGNRGSGV